MRWYDVDHILVIRITPRPSLRRFRISMYQPRKLSYDSPRGYRCQSVYWAEDVKKTIRRIACAGIAAAYVAATLSFFENTR